MIRLNRLRHLQRAMEATDRGEWHDLGRATHGLRLWFRKHGFVEPRPTSDPAWPSWRDVKVTDKGRAALAEAKKEYARHSNPTRAEQRRVAALKEELADAFGFNVDKIGLDGRAITLRRVVLTPNGITSLRKAVEEHERHHSFSKAAREKP